MRREQVVLVHLGMGRGMETGVEIGGEGQAVFHIKPQYSWQSNNVLRARVAGPAWVHGPAWPRMALHGGRLGHRGTYLPYPRYSPPLQPPLPPLTFASLLSVSRPCWMTRASNRSFLYAFSITWGGGAGGGGVKGEGGEGLGKREQGTAGRREGREWVRGRQVGGTGEGGGGNGDGAGRGAAFPRLGSQCDSRSSGEKVRLGVVGRASAPA